MDTSQTPAGEAATLPVRSAANRDDQPSMTTRSNVVAV